GVAMATLHRWTRVYDGDTGVAVRCCLLRGGRMRPPDPDTNGSDLRTGLVFNFRFYPHGNSSQEARIPRTGWETTQPLLAYTVNDTGSPKSLPKRQSLATVAVASGKGDALLTCLKQAEDGKGVVARWYEATGQACQVRAALSPTDTRVRRANMLEQPTAKDAASGGAVATAAWEIVTVRTER
ncbi:MAG: glycosyl hydrolase-related protein, partial [Verrucomicrobiae bacterium]|nr:glycosyl hydrolase-related protein [Verrucomicrobiae bacterium]